MLTAEQSRGCGGPGYPLLPAPRHAQVPGLGCLPTFMAAGAGWLARLACGFRQPRLGAQGLPSCGAGVVWQEQTLVSEAARRKERELVAREIERLRSSIQTVCRSALPLGKIMDYIQEDMDAMQIELQSWRRENKEHAQALLQEQRWVGDTPVGGVGVVSALVEAVKQICCSGVRTFLVHLQCHLWDQDEMPQNLNG